MSCGTFHSTARTEMANSARDFTKGRGSPLRLDLLIRGVSELESAELGYESAASVRVSKARL